MDTKPLILASSSPRRRQLLAALGIPFTVDPAHIDERILAQEPPTDHVRRLAETKARTVAARHPQAVILAADTIVLLDGHILGKPTSPEHARAMLQALRGRGHHVITAVAVTWPPPTPSAPRPLLAQLDTSTVVMRPYTDADIDAYIASGDPMDKAGAYAIQHPTFRPVARLKGCFASVMGLPLALTAHLLTQAGLTPRNDWPQHCHAITGQCCALPHS